MAHAHTLGGRVYRFDDLKSLLAKATPERSGDQLAGIAAESDEERMAARLALADLPLATFLREPLIPYEVDEVTRLIVDTHDSVAFAPVAHLTVGAFRDWLLSDTATTTALTALSPGLTPEMVAAVSKLMQSGPDPGRPQVHRRHALPFHDRPAWPARGAAAAEPSHRRHQRRGRLDARWPAARSARSSAVAEARHAGRQRHVLRDRPGLGAVGGCAPRRRPADLRSTGLCGGARVQSAADQHRRRLHRAGVPVRSTMRCTCANCWASSARRNSKLGCSVSASPTRPAGCCRRTRVTPCWAT